MRFSLGAALPAADGRGSVAGCSPRLSSDVSIDLIAIDTGEEAVGVHELMSKNPLARLLVAALASAVVAAAAPPGAQRRGAAGGAVSFAVLVTDENGAPLQDASVMLTGAARRTGRTEGGRLAFEGLPAGAYRFRFEKEGFVPLERELTARGPAPMEVKAALTPAPAPPRPIAAVAAAPERVVDAKPRALDLPTYIKNNYVGRAPGKATGIACATGGAANLLQINDPLKEHTHGDSDEFIYVVAGQGTARIGGRDEPLDAGVFVMIPRNVPHAFTPGRQKPLMVLSVLAGDKCTP